MGPQGAAHAVATRAIQALSEAFVRVDNAGDLDGLVEAFSTKDGYGQLNYSV
jgi:hypothetical protein